MRHHSNRAMKCLSHTSHITAVLSVAVWCTYALLTNNCCPCISFSVQQEEQTIHPSSGKTYQNELSAVFEVCVCVYECVAI